MLIIGCRPEGRLIEQHDIFFGIAPSLKELIPAMKRAWPEAKGKLHIDAWREVTQVNEFNIRVVPVSNEQQTDPLRLFFINLGGYKPGEFEEFHYKTLAVAADKGGAVQQAKKTAFYKHTGFEGAVSHIDDKYGVDVDDLHAIEDILSEEFKNKYSLAISMLPGKEDLLHIGYYNLDKLSDEY